MNKYDRLDEITKLINKRGTVRTNEIVEGLNVSDMTVRRDLAELEEKGVLTKIHGGARSNSAFQYKEMSHQENIRTTLRRNAISPKSSRAYRKWWHNILRARYYCAKIGRRNSPPFTYCYHQLFTSF